MTEIVLSAETSDRTTSRAFEVVADPILTRDAKVGACYPTWNPTTGQAACLLDGSSCLFPKPKNPKTNKTVAANRNSDTARRRG